MQAFQNISQNRNYTISSRLFANNVCFYMKQRMYVMILTSLIGKNGLDVMTETSSEEIRLKPQNLQNRIFEVHQGWMEPAEVDW